MILVLVLLAEQSCVVACAASVSFAFGTTTIFVAQLLERWSVSVHARGAMVWRCFFHRGHHRMLRRCVCYHRQRSAGNRRRRRPRRRQNHRRSPQALGRPFASAGIHIVAFRLPEILLSAKTFAVTAANRVAPEIGQPVQSMDGAAKGTALSAPPPGPFGAMTTCRLPLRRRCRDPQCGFLAVSFTEGRDDDCGGDNFRPFCCNRCRLRWVSRSGASAGAGDGERDGAEEEHDATCEMTPFT